jgi:cyanophycinase
VIGRLAFLTVAVVLAAPTPSQYYLTGSHTDSHQKGRPGFALIGGATDVDEFFQWLIGRSAGGDMVVLRASGGDGYNDYLYRLGGLNSVQTVVISNAESAREPFVVDRIRRAEALFIAGGDQWKYVSLWNHSPVGEAIQQAIDRGVPIGGTSAGLAVLGEYVFSAQQDTVTSVQALSNPFDAHVTISTNFLHIPFLKNTITDTHFHARDRMGRTLVFLARILHDNRLHEARAIAIDERTAALVEPNGSLHVAGMGNVYFLRAFATPTVCSLGQPLTFKPVEVYRAGASSHFDLNSWRGDGGTAYQVSVENGTITSNQGDGSIY